MGAWTAGAWDSWSSRCGLTFVVDVREGGDVLVDVGDGSNLLMDVRFGRRGSNLGLRGW